VTAAIDVVDAHHHLWNLSGPIRYPWLTDEPHEFFLGDYGPIRRTYLPEDYRRDAARQRVVRTVHVEAECDRSMQVAETRWLTEISARHGMPNAIVAHAWFDRPDTDEVLAAQAAFPLVRGIRSKPLTAARPGERLRPGTPGSMTDPKWLTGFARLEKHGLSWDLRVPPWHLEEAAEVARAFPSTAIVLNHTGFPWDRSPEGLRSWRRGMEALADCPNVHTKISELGLPDRPWRIEDNRPIVLDAIRIFGVDRCMFASNFPVSGLRATFDHIFDAFRAIVGHLPQPDQAKLLGQNAMRFYRIDP